MKRAFVAVAVALASACGPQGEAPSSSNTAPSAPAQPTAPASTAQARLLEAEQRRAAQAVEKADLSSRSVADRRAAARALSRIAGAPARQALLLLLADEDPEVVAWAAYGLGFDCADAKAATVSALVARSLAVPDEPRFDATWISLARAIGSCADADRSEATLVAWLDGSPARARAASLGLGDLAGRTKKLREDTWAALLTRAAGGVSSDPVPEALFAVSRVENVQPTIHERMAEVASARLANEGPFRLFAIRALGRVRQHGLAGVERVLTADKSRFTLPERVEALRAAARLGDDGAVLLARSLGKLTDVGAEALSQGGDDAQLLLSAIAAIKDVNAAKPELSRVVALKLEGQLNPRQKRVLSMLRCAAAALTLKPQDAALLACDFDKGSIGKRALLSALGRSEIAAAGKATFAALLKDPDHRVRIAALELYAAHSELEDATSALTSALAAKEPGVVATAAEQIAKRPALASKSVKKAKPKTKAGDKDDQPGPVAELAPPAPEVVSALVAALARGKKEHDPELTGAIMDAIGALGDKSLLAKLEPFCASSWPTERERAKSAIALLSGGKKPACPAPSRAEELGPEPLAVGAPFTVRLETEVGELSIAIDPTLAPITAERVRTLVSRGYYDGNLLHRVDPSFVVQFGAPFGDGFGGPPDLPPLRCETSPLPFEQLSVGVALSGRDTGSSQLFVMRARHPHLDGGYPLIGKASGPWDQILEGDAIKKATIVP